MKKIGWLLVILGAGSFGLDLIDYEFSLLAWIDNWGVEAGWAIRGAMVVAGGVLVFMGMKAEAGEPIAETVEAHVIEPPGSPESEPPGSPESEPPSSPENE